MGGFVQKNQDPTPLKENGTQAVVGAAIAVIGVLAAANPQSVLLKALNNAAPQLATAVPMVITACGAIIAAFSQPPRFSRGAIRE
jgi:ribosomal protein S7